VACQMLAWISSFSYPMVAEFAYLDCDRRLHVHLLDHGLIAAGCAWNSLNRAQNSR